MRPRFSLRWLLIGFTFLTVIFYLLFIRPTVVAQRLVSAVKNGERSPGILGTWGHHPWQVEKAALQPRTWPDIWQFRRRVRVDTSFTDASGMYTHCVLEYAAGPIDYQLKTTQTERLLTTARHWEDCSYRPANVPGAPRSISDHSILAG
jgi:hypothetical protein